VRVQDLAGNTGPESRFAFASDGATQTFTFNWTNPPSPIETLVFGADSATIYLVSDLQIA
jgi:hypothetical protein